MGGGTWLCAHINGRLSFLTNVRRQRQLESTKLTSSAPIPVPSRGLLPINFVTSTATPREYLSNINGQEFPGFNLIVADLAAGTNTAPGGGGDGGGGGTGGGEGEGGGGGGEGGAGVGVVDGTGSRTSTTSNTCTSSHVLYFTNSDYAKTPIQELSPGIHGLSNAALDTPWPKVTRGCRQFEQLAASGAFDGPDFPWNEVFAVMKDATLTETDPAKLPCDVTGYSVDFERSASAVFMDPPVEVEGVAFGTRSVTVLAVPRRSVGKAAELREEYLTAEGGWAVERHVFDMKTSST